MQGCPDPLCRVHAAHTTHAGHLLMLQYDLCSEGTHLQLAGRDMCTAAGLLAACIDTWKQAHDPPQKLVHILRHE